MRDRVLLMRHYLLRRVENWIAWLMHRSVGGKSAHWKRWPLFHLEASLRSYSSWSCIRGSRAQLRPCEKGRISYTDEVLI